jgi:serine/threonine-protein kinase HipA
MVVYQLAKAAGLNVPDTQLLSLGSRHRTFASRRFDRLANGRRRFFVSAMTLLNRQDGENASYLELAEFLSTRGSPVHKETDLRELWTRIIFNILVSNRDDHLRNHGFILSADGWRLAPAYDLNPNIERTHHQLAIDSSDPTPDVALALATAEFYGLTQAHAAKILQRVRVAIGQWRTVAANLRLPRAEIERLAQAFSLPPAGS